MLKKEHDKQVKLEREEAYRLAMERQRAIEEGEVDAIGEQKIGEAEEILHDSKKDHSFQRVIVKRHGSRDYGSPNQSPNQSPLQSESNLVSNVNLKACRKISL